MPYQYHYKPPISHYIQPILLTIIVLLGLSASAIYIRRHTTHTSPVSQISQPIDVIQQTPQINITAPAERKNLLSFMVTDGDTLMSILQGVNISNDDIQNVITSLAAKYDPKKLHIGQNIIISFDLPADNSNAPLRLQTLKLKLSLERQVIAQRSGNGFRISEVITPLEKHIIRKHAVITDSLMSTVDSMGVPANLMPDLIKAYSYDVDFQRDIQPGDKFDIVYENFYTQDGQLAKEGNVIFSSLTLGDKHYNIYRHTTSDGRTDYFDENGFSVKKEFLRTPLAVAHITSGFGMRHHPILGYSKMHKGIDFAATTGTPIFAAGSGTVEEMGRKGSYGNYVRIRHNAHFSTAYAHISRFNKDFHKGDHVEQGDIIAYVGATGRATGPHLHYEVLIDNVQINPLSMKVSPGVKLAGAELDRFFAYKKKLQTVLAQNNGQSELAFDNANGLKKVN